jgi:hypothetical protein
MIRRGLLSFLLVLSMSTVASSQAKSQEFSGGLEFALPNDALEDAVVAGFGLSLRYEKSFTNRLSWVGDIGFILFTGKNNGTPISVFPFQCGIKYYFQESLKGLYGMGEAGFHSFHGGEGANGTDFSYAPAIGYHFKNIDVNVKYQFISSSWISASFVGVRVSHNLFTR